MNNMSNIEELEIYAYIGNFKTLQICVQFEHQPGEEGIIKKSF